MANALLSLCWHPPPPPLHPPPCTPPPCACSIHAAYVSIFSMFPPFIYSRSLSFSLREWTRRNSEGGLEGGYICLCRGCKVGGGGKKRLLVSAHITLFSPFSLSLCLSLSLFVLCNSFSSFRTQQNCSSSSICSAARWRCCVCVCEQFDGLLPHGLGLLRVEKVDRNAAWFTWANQITPRPITGYLCARHDYVAY